MPDSYDTVLAEAVDEFTEKRSRFIGAIFPVSGEAEAQERLARVRASNRGANHNCFAYILNDNAAMRYSDDGEPQPRERQPQRAGEGDNAQQDADAGQHRKGGA